MPVLDLAIISCAADFPLGYLIDPIVSAAGLTRPTRALRNGLGVSGCILARLWVTIAARIAKLLRSTDRKTQMERIELYRDFRIRAYEDWSGEWLAEAKKPFEANAPYIATPFGHPT